MVAVIVRRAIGLFVTPSVEREVVRILVAAGPLNSICINTSLSSDEAPNRNQSGDIQRGPSVSYRTTR